MHFNLYVKKIFAKSPADNEWGFKVNDMPINSLGNADDSLVITGNIEDLQLFYTYMKTRRTSFLYIFPKKSIRGKQMKQV